MTVKLVVCLAALWPLAGWAADDAILDTVEIITDTPASSGGVSLKDVPAPVQVVSHEQLEKAQSTSVAEYMNRYLSGVTVNDAQNNPLQPDVQFRGFTASPLLGLPQGLAVYVNGVRFNEAFGDTVNWDLVPEGAIDSMALHSGSSAVYGLNAIGGALSMRTKTGFSAPKHQIEVSGGAWGRHTEELQSGANNGRFAYFIDIKSFQEDGWRDFSPSDAKQVFGTLSWQGEVSKLNLNLAGTDNSLIGNGAVPIQLFKQDNNAIFTYPDRTINRMFLASLDGSTWLNKDTELSGNVYFRQNRTRTFNGDGTPYEECEDPTLEGFLCDEDGEQVFDIGGNPISDDPLNRGAESNAVANHGQVNQRGLGGMLQLAFNQDLFAHKNRLVIGGGHDQGHAHYSADTEIGYLTDTRGVDGAGIFADEPRVRLHTKVLHNGFFITDTLHLTDQLAVTAAGRYNLSFIKLSDRDGTDLNGFHKYQRFNPAAGFTYEFVPEVSAYGGYSEATRVPTPVELGCANPDKPCRLPNAFLADPPLKQVVAKTFEAGFRGSLDRLLWEGGQLNWNAGFFQTINHDDIVFLTGGSALVNGQGYFQNVGRTKREGFELGLGGQVRNHWRVNANYTFLNATYQSDFTVNSPNHPKADADGNLQVSKGDRIPGLPRHLLKLGTEVDPINDVTLGADMQLSSSRYLRGDEANQGSPIGGYAVFNLRGEYRITPNFALFGRLDNLFDRRYKSFGMYGNPSEVLGDGYNDTRFVGVGAPRAGWVGIRLSL